jgi:hypothetical protein
VLLVGLWRALEVGTLHAYHSVRLELLARLARVGLVEAGGAFARSDALAPAALPLLIALGGRLGLRPLLVALPLLSLGALGLLALHAPGAAGAAGASGVRASLGAVVVAFSLLEVGAPIVALALLPRLAAEAGAADGRLAHAADDGSDDGSDGSDERSDGGPDAPDAPPSPTASSASSASSAATTERLGTAYGTIETLFALVQIGITLLLGEARAAAGPADLAAPLSLMAGGFAAAAAVSALLVGASALRTPRARPLLDGASA